LKQVLQTGQKQSLSLTPGLKQSLKFLTLNNVELTQSLKEICEENPFIEIDIHSQEIQIEDLVSEQPEATWNSNDNESQRSRNALTGDVPFDVYARQENFRTLTTENFRAELKEQLISNNINEADRNLVAFLIDSVDENGFLTETYIELKPNFPKNSGWTESDFEKCKKYLQSLEPVGVASRDLSDFLCFQILHSKHPTHIQEIATRICLKYLKQVSTKSHQKIAIAIGCDASDTEEAVRLITNLKPQPITDKTSSHHLEIIPDLKLTTDNDKVIIRVNSDSIPDVFLSTDYEALSSQSDDILNEQIRRYLSDAKHITRSLEQRKLTLIRVAGVIFDVQRKFLKHGNKGLRPLTLQEVADRLDIHESTVSRATNGKYIETPRGTYELKYFFAGRVNADENASSRYIKELITKIIKSENIQKPLSDKKIQALLEKKNIEIARRTIAKYREQLGILPSNMRMKI